MSFYDCFLKESKSCYGNENEAFVHIVKCFFLKLDENYLIKKNKINLAHLQKKHNFHFLFCEICVIFNIRRK